MNVTEIPLSPDNQLFRIQLAETTYTLRVIWRDSAGWILDVQDSSGEPLLSGVPLVRDYHHHACRWLYRCGSAPGDDAGFQRVRRDTGHYRRFS
ncbi:TPA: phage baseplate plug family protein [Escherichia coli]